MPRVLPAPVARPRFVPSSALTWRLHAAADQSFSLVLANVLLRWLDATETREFRSLTTVGRLAGAPPAYRISVHDPLQRQPLLAYLKQNLPCDWLGVADGKGSILLADLAYIKHAALVKRVHTLTIPRRELGLFDRALLSQNRPQSGNGKQPIFRSITRAWPDMCAFAAGGARANTDKQLFYRAWSMETLGKDAPAWLQTAQFTWDGWVLCAAPANSTGPSQPLTTESVPD